ncbi:MAG: hypothetical protein KME20_26845 [Kaiparowitsia implicata GSE-PSE-MK54-09C]|nr:hypothetical protein [Kaiparowitsia implicata GSE-PSE-MK54-09C]
MRLSPSGEGSLRRRSQSPPRTKQAFEVSDLKAEFVGSAFGAYSQAGPETARDTHLTEAVRNGGAVVAVKTDPDQLDCVSGILDHGHPVEGPATAMRGLQRSVPATCRQRYPEPSRSGGSASQCWMRRPLPAAARMSWASTDQPTAGGEGRIPARNAPWRPVAMEPCRHRTVADHGE